MQKLKEILDNNDKDKISISEVIDVLQSFKITYTDESIRENAVKIYERIPITYRDIVAAKDALLEYIWKLKGDCYKINAFQYDSIWKNYSNERYDEISKQLLLIKRRYPEERISNLYNNASPQTIVIYHQYFNNSRDELVKFDALHPFVFDKLELIPTKDEIDCMLYNFPSYFPDIIKINTHVVDNVTIQKYISKQYSLEPEIPKLALNCEVYPEIYEHLCLDDISSSKKTDVLKNIENILSCKVIPNKHTFHMILKYGLRNNAIELLIEYGYIITNDDLITMLKFGIDFDYIHKITDILLDEDDYFKLYINKDTSSGLYKIFKPELRTKIKLRQLFINSEYNDAIKFMKEHNMQPDRYCLDSIYGTSGNSKKSLMNLILEFKCIPKIGIRQLQSLKYGSTQISDDGIFEICKKNGIDAAYMSSY